MMAPAVRHHERETPSASGRHNDRVTDPIHGLEWVDSGPQRLPVEPACVLDPKGGGCAVSWQDVHAKSTVWCLLDAQGQVVSEGRVATSAPALRALVRELSSTEEVVAGQEVGTLTYLMHDTV